MRDVCESTGKLQYQSKQAADAALRVHDDGRPKTRRTYKCGQCNRWHLTSKVGKR